MTTSPVTDTSATGSPTAGVAVQMTGLERAYGDVRALDGLDLHMDPGEMVVLLPR